MGEDMGTKKSGIENAPKDPYKVSINLCPSTLCIEVECETLGTLVVAGLGVLFMGFGMGWVLTVIF